MACANTRFNDQAQPHIALRRAYSLVLRPGVCHRVTSAFLKEWSNLEKNQEIKSPKGGFAFVTLKQSNMMRLFFT